MSFVETDILGVYVAPISLMLIAAFGVFFCVRKIISHLGWFDFIWHPGLFEFALYMIILSSLVLLAASVPHG